MPLPKFAAWLINAVRGQPAAKTAVVPAFAAASRRRKQRKADDARDAILGGSVPEDFSAGTLDLSGERQSFTLPARLQCFELNLANSSVAALPPGIRVEHRLDLSNCAAITSLPDGLTIGTLVLTGCTGLTALPENLSVHFLVLDGCRALAHWPESARVTLGRVAARNCAALPAVPATLGPVTSLDLSGCGSIRAIPDGVRVTGWLDLQGTGVAALPLSLHDVHLRWRGVSISERVVFKPETITAAEVLAEPNAEVRRVMLDRMGLDRFLAEARATVRDEDTDPGGKRQLVAVDLPGDEALVCVIVHCPSTARRYLIRVPPTMQTCRDAVAWTAGFDKAEDYQPVKET